jgi:hypothetical protein
MHVAALVEICVKPILVFMPYNLELAGFKTKASQPIEAWDMVVQTLTANFGISSSGFHQNGGP